MGLKQGESIDEEFYVTDATNESVSGSVSGTARGTKADEGSGSSGGPGASTGGTNTLEEPVTPAKRQPNITLAVCIGSAPVVPSLVKTWTTSKILFAKKGAAFKEAGFQVRKMAKETLRMLEEEGVGGQEDAMVLAKVKRLEENIADVVQVCKFGEELVSRTADAVDDVIRDTCQTRTSSVIARLLRNFIILYHRGSL